MYYCNVLSKICLVQFSMVTMSLCNMSLYCVSMCRLCGNSKDIAKVMLC